MLLTHPPSSTHVTIPFTTPTTPRTRFEDRVCVHGCWRQGRYTCRGCARDSGQTTVLIDTIWLGERASECVVGLTGYLTGHVMIDLAAMTEHWWFEITVTEQTADPTVVGSSSSVFLCMYVCCLLVWLWVFFCECTPYFLLKKDGSFFPGEFSTQTVFNHVFIRLPYSWILPTIVLLKKKRKYHSTTQTDTG